MKEITIPPYFTNNTTPLTTIEYELRESQIHESNGSVIFHFSNVEVPKFWSQLSTDILASKYLRKAGVPNKYGYEHSIKEVIKRIVWKITQFGLEHNYFNVLEGEKFKNELTYILIHQIAAFNSPVWFNCGLDYYNIKRRPLNFYWNPQKQKVEKVPKAYKYPQCAACFIQSVNDDLEDIFELIKTESRLFKYGSGTGTNFSTLRSKYEKLSGGGTSSGVLSFLKVFDAGAGATKSGGITRRGAKIVILNIDHPEAPEFIEWKAKEERKANALIKAGYSSNFNGEAYQTINGQNANNSIRVTNKFMQAVEKNEIWWTRYVTTGKKCKKYKARDLWDSICSAAWECADPGIQFDTTINNWNTIPNTGRINAVNPCAEISQPDNTSCNLSSINLLKFLNEDGTFNWEGFKHTIRLLILAQEILIDLSSYPTAEITQNTHNQRALGLGYANLGALLMCMGFPYDSLNGRHQTGKITSFMTASAYQMSAELAKIKGPFSEYEKNKFDMLKILRKHRYKAFNGTRKEWDKAIELGEKYGFRNSQVTCLAPTGTIGLLMGCDTTGIEPDFALIKTKKLSGGGTIQIVNQSIPKALKNLGYKKEKIDQIITELKKSKGNIEKTSIKKKHYNIFDCAVATEGTDRCIDPMAHVLMMAAAQPFISEGISKTVNLPHNCTPKDIGHIYLQAWKLGLKAIAIYRDGCKASQPLNSGKKTKFKKAPDCIECGYETIRNGTCFKCENCGTSMGCS